MNDTLAVSMLIFAAVVLVTMAIAVVVRGSQGKLAADRHSPEKRAVRRISIIVVCVSACVVIAALLLIPPKY